MNQRQFLSAWMRVRPRRCTRSDHMVAGIRLHRCISNAIFPLRSPRLWWYCRRVYLANAFGLPMPKTDRERGRLQA